MKKQTKTSQLKLNKLKISQLTNTQNIYAGIGGGSRAEVGCTGISLIRCSLQTDTNADADYITD